MPTRHRNEGEKRLQKYNTCDICACFLGLTAGDLVQCRVVRSRVWKGPAFNIHAWIRLLTT